ncbi:MAG: EAL domain-containing protein [Hyphomicrobium sp.]
MMSDQKPTSAPGAPLKTETGNLPGTTLAGQPVAAPQSLVAAGKRARERLVLVSMALVTAAASALLYAIFEYPLASAVLSGGLLWAGLMALHIQFKKNAEIARLKSELARVESQRASDAPSVPMAQTVPAVDASAVKPRSVGGRRSVPGQHPATAAANPVSLLRGGTDSMQDVSAAAGQAAESAMPGAAVGGPAGPQTHPRWEMPGQQGRPARATAAAPQQASATAPSAGSTLPRGKHAAPPPPPVETALWPGTSLSAADPMRDQWAFRPKDVGLPPLPVMDGDDQPMTSMPASTIDADLEMVQRKIKALADEVNAADIGRERQPMPTGFMAAGMQHTATPNAGANSALEKSIGALKATAETMRERPAPQQRPAPRTQTPADPTPQTQTLPFDLLIPATAERIAISDLGAPPAQAQVAQSVAAAPPPAAPPLDDVPVLELPTLPVFEFTSSAPPNPRLAAIIAAVENGEMDVFLSPIVALQSHQVSHYDVTVRVRAATGGYLENAEQELQLAGSDVLALFDTARLKRAAMLAQRLDAHNKPGSLLSAVNGPSITNAEFLETFARVYEERDRISNQLVLTFTQADLEQFSPSAWQALSDMHAFGFRFALSQIDHVAMDFASLAERGFAFLRLDASALLGGLPARDHFVAADELCKLLAGAGMTLVADTIDDEAVRARVFGFGVLLGQGRLFGGARQVKLDPLPSGSSAAA